MGHALGRAHVQNSAKRGSGFYGLELGMGVFFADGAHNAPALLQGSHGQRMPTVCRLIERAILSSMRG